jgi:hypothetical protein
MGDSRVNENITLPYITIHFADRRIGALGTTFGFAKRCLAPFR